jgi:hypothetical protein
MADRDRELTSWKDIAAYLGVNISTAQNWERERSLPVCRLPGRRSRVSVTTTALDIWKQRSGPLSPVPVVHACSWSMSSELEVEVRFVGAAPTSETVELLREHLDLFKRSLAAVENRKQSPE